MTLSEGEILSPMREVFDENERDESWRPAKGAEGGSSGEFMPASMCRVDAAADCMDGECEFTEDVREWLRRFLGEEQCRQWL